MRYKFKAWDKNAKKWYDRVQVGNDSDDAHYVCHSVYDEERGWLEFDEHCGTVVQWTGLQDRAGLDIYEGDIVKGKDDDGKRIIGEVQYRVTRFSVNGIGKYMFIQCSLNSRFEIIGNRFDNPELLKGE